jgi:hypothetical protein
MSWASLILSCLPTVLKLIERFVVWTEGKQLMDAGRQQAIVEASASLNSILSRAAAAAQEAAEKHAKVPTDDAFDREFERKD